MRILILAIGLSLISSGMLGCSTTIGPCPSASPSCFDSTGVVGSRLLVDRAWDEYVRRGGRIVRTEAVATVSQEGGRIRVFHQFVPAAPGGHFAVEFDAISGELVRYSPGH
jgi:hypothetical protein